MMVHLWLPALGLHRCGPVNSLSWMRDAHGALPFSTELFATSRWSLFLVLYLQGAHQPPADSSKPKVDQMDLIKLSGSQNKGKPHECEEVVYREDGGGGDKRGCYENNENALYTCLKLSKQNAQGLNKVRKWS